MFPRNDPNCRNKVGICIQPLLQCTVRLTVDHLHDAAVARQFARQLVASGYHLAGSSSGDDFLVGLLSAAHRVKDVAARKCGVDGARVGIIGRPVERVLVEAGLGDGAVGPA